MQNYSSYSDEQLITRLRAGETQIMDFLLEKYKPLVRKKTNTLFLIGGDTDDLIQEGMIGLFKAVRDFDEGKDSSFYNFAQLCISRQLFTALEASNRKKHQPLNSYVSLSTEESDGDNLLDFFASNSCSPEKMVIEQEKFEEFKSQLWEKLSNMERRVLSLYLEGNNYIQISKMMDRSPKAIDNALQRIRQKTKRK